MYIYIYSLTHTDTQSGPTCSTCSILSHASRLSSHYRGTSLMRNALWVSGEAATRVFRSGMACGCGAVVDGGRCLAVDDA